MFANLFFFLVKKFKKHEKEYSFTYFDASTITPKIKEDFVKYLETLSYNEYIKVYRENNRNIMIGGNNG